MFTGIYIEGMFKIYTSCQPHCRGTWAVSTIYIFRNMRISANVLVCLIQYNGQLYFVVYLYLASDCTLQLCWGSIPIHVMDIQKSYFYQAQD